MLLSNTKLQAQNLIIFGATTRVLAEHFSHKRGRDGSRLNKEADVPLLAASGVAMVVFSSAAVTMVKESDFEELGVRIFDHRATVTMYSDLAQGQKVLPLRTADRVKNPRGHNPIGVGILGAYYYFFIWYHMDIPSVGGRKRNC